VSTQTQQARPLDVQVIGRRISAVVIDYFVLGIALGMLFWVFSLIFPNLPVVTAQQGTPPVELGRSLLDAALFGLALQGLLRPIYFIGLEGYDGQTIGKRIVGIKVVSESTGQVGGFGVAIKRNLPRLVVSGLLLVVYVLGYIGLSRFSVGPDANDIETVIWGVTGIVGLLTMSFSGKTQRLGDMLARTLVVGK